MANRGLGYRECRSDHERRWVLKTLSLLSYTAISVILSLIALAAVAADYPAPNAGDWLARDFRFHTGEVLPELRLH
jgi:homoserine O-acetyltransferase